MKPLSKQFIIRYGNKKLHNKENLDIGHTLVVSSSGVNNGFYGFFDTNATIIPPVISVPSTGSVGEAFVQLHSCSIDDNCLVLKPKKPYVLEYLFYVANKIRLEKWRFMYGRQITPYRLGKLEVLSDEEIFSSKWETVAKRLTPEKTPVSPLKYEQKQFKEFKITDFFTLVRGSFHAIDRLKNGIYPTVSRIDDDNGIVGFFNKPRKATLFTKGILTVSTVTGDTFLQHQPFIATDNVVILIPKIDLSITTIIYIQALMNKVKWRYSYGRQCYKGILQKTMLLLPINSEGKLDEKYIDFMVKYQPYWKAIEKSLIATS